IVSTPIGNLKDICLRAIEVLQSVDYILCEDTRRASKLKNHYQLKPKLISFHDHNERKRIPQIVERMSKGRKFALISDAGMPLISDPGYLLVKELIRLGIQITCVPGPSAVLAALTLSGFPVQSFAFHGFLPPAAAARRAKLERLAAMPEQTLVLFESPERIVGLLREIGEVLGDRNVALCREITKLHEEILRGSVSELLTRIAPRRLKGEFTVVIAPGEESHIQMTDEMILARFRQLESEGVNRKDLLKRLSKESGRSRNEIYRLLFESK
ncbi:MAG TPA: 16S rRNA (cytidine(1402)-2'-O)-methyltransferase, partial [Acidobacteriota bacterium]|nr:16S rRNA (cytidine(1402)-2'-O)-methyltransferase [Acidobacteriota bacterium]